MAHRIEVGLAEGVKDAPGEKVRRRVASELGIRLDGVRIVDVYTVDAELGGPQLVEVAGAPLSDPVIQRAAVNAPLYGEQARFDWAIEVALRPGVTSALCGPLASK